MQTIYLDISNKGVIPAIYAKQGDVGRKFEVVLTDEGVPYYPADGSAFSVWYSGASGEGNYTDIGDKSAFSLTGNKVTVEMVSQMLLNDGDGFLALVLNDADGNQISTWNIPYICEFVPGADSEEAKNYYTAFSEAVKNLPYPDASLSVPGKAADAKATGDKIESLTAEQVGASPATEDTDHPGCYYRMVNGEKEWINPPLILGVEYRTTERDNGKPVYAKPLNLGAMPNASTSQYSFGFNETVNLVDVNVRTSGGSQIPHYLNASGVGTASYYNNMNTIWVTTTENRSGSTLIVKLKYVKE